MSSNPPTTTRKRGRIWRWMSSRSDRPPPAGSSPTPSGHSSIAASLSTSRPATPQSSQHRGSSSATQQPQHEDVTNSGLWPDRGIASGDSGKLKSTLDAVITLMRRINPTMDGTPAKIPFAVILSLASVYEDIQKLDESGLETYNKLADRLVLLRQALIASDDVETQAKIISFLEFLYEYGLQLETARGKKTFSKMARTPEIQAVLQELDRKLSDRTQLFHLDISLAQGREMKRGLDNLMNISTDVYNRIETELRHHISQDSQLGGSFLKETCAKGTRVDVLARIRSWVLRGEGEGGDELWPIQRLEGSNDQKAHTDQAWGEDASQCLCIVGVPGSGKSTIAASIAGDLLGIQECDSSIIIAHYFVRRDADSTMNHHSIFPTLALRLAHLSPSFAMAMHEKIEGISTAVLNSLETSAKTLLLDPATALRHKILLVIDALDELSKPEKLARSLANIIQQLPPNIRLILTTRPEDRILRNLGQHLVDKISLEIRTSDSVADVNLYLSVRLRSEIEEICGDEEEWKSWPTASQIDAMARRAEGLFVWAATAITSLVEFISRYGLAGRDMFLQRILASNSLDHLYSLVLDQAYGNDEDEDPVRLEKARLFLGFLVVAAEPLSVDSIARLLELDNDANFDAHWFFRSARSVLVQNAAQITGDTPPQMHKTFVDYLTSSSAGRFHIRTHEAHHSAFIHCYKNMKSSLHFNMGSIQSSYDLDEENPGLYDHVKTKISQQSKYAYQHWATHLPAPDNIALDDLLSAQYTQSCSSSLHDFLRLKVLFWMEAMNLLRQDCRDAIGLAKSWAQWINDHELTANLEDVDRVWTSFRSDAAFHSTPHLYISSLSAELGMQTMPSVASRNWRSSFPNIPAVECNSIHRSGVIRTIRTAAHVDSVAFSHDSTLVVSGSYDNTVRIWDAKSGEEVAKMEGHDDRVNSVAFSHDSTLVMSGSSDNTVRIWDAKSGEEVAKMEGHDNWVNSVAFSHDSTLVVSGSYDNTVRIWDAKSGEEVAKMEVLKVQVAVAQSTMVPAAYEA